MNKKFIILHITLILSLLFLVTSPALVKNGYQNGDEYPRGCSYLRCVKGDQCVNRKFWCKNPPCPSMLYCSKSRKESLKGPSSCESVRCSKGYVCLVRARRCRWDQKCKQQIARCISEREYYEGATSCLNFRCPEGHQCIMRESLCARPPCKLLKSCAKFKDVQTWFDVCKSLGCPSEHECFLRRPFDKCSLPPCKHTPDCTSTDDMENDGSGNEYCRGWVCPRMQKCSAHMKEPCKLETCKITRSCHGPLIMPENQPANRGTLTWKPAKYQPVTVIPTPPSSARNTDSKNRKTLTQLEQELVLRDQNKRKQPLLSSTSATIGITTNAPKMIYTDLRNSLQQRDNFGMSRGLKQLNDVISTVSTTTAMGINREIPTYNEPIFVTSTIKPTSMISVTTSPKTLTSSSGTFESQEPTLSSLSSWLNHLKLKTGIDAIEQWVKIAQKRKDYPQFKEWLKSVKELLGPPIFETWLEEVRSLTQENPEFQEWLPKPPRYQILDSHHFYDPDSRMGDMENEGLIAFPGSERFMGRSNDNSIGRYNQKERSSSTVLDYDNFSSKSKDESERFLSSFPEEVVKYNTKFRSAFGDVRMSTTTTTTAATSINSAPWTEDDYSRNRIIKNNSHSQGLHENSAIFPEKLPLVTTTISWKDKNDESTINFEKFDSKLSNEFHVGQSSHFEKPTYSPKNVEQSYRGVVNHEPEVKEHLTNVSQFISNLDYPYFGVNQNLSNDPYRNFENSIVDPYVQTPIVNRLGYYSNPTRNINSRDAIVYNVYRNDLQEMPPFTESFQISEYPFSHLPSVFPEALMPNDFQNFWSAQQLASYLPRARTKHSNTQWTFPKYPDLNDMKMAAKSKLPYNEYPFSWGLYGGRGNNYQPDTNQYLMNPRLIEDRSIRNLLIPKFTSFPYEPSFNIPNPVGSRYVSLLGYVPQIPVDEKDQALTTYSLSRNPMELNPFDKYLRSSVNIEDMDNPKIVSPYNSFLDKQITENTQIGMEDTHKTGLQILPEKYQGSLEHRNLKRDQPTNTWKESGYRIHKDILTENQLKIPGRYLPWKFPERQKVPEDRKTVVTSHPQSYKSISQDRMSDVDRSYFLNKDDYARKNGREFSKKIKSLPTQEVKRADEYLSESGFSTTIPNNIFQQEPSDYLTDEYSEAFQKSPQDRDGETLAEIPKNIVTTIPPDESIDDAPLTFSKNDEKSGSPNYEVFNENYENYSETPNFQENTDYTDEDTRRHSGFRNNNNNIFHTRSDLEFAKNHLNGDNNDTINSEAKMVARHRKKNILKNKQYGGYSDFPKNLKTVYSIANNVELKRLFGNFVVPRGSNEDVTINNIRKSKNEHNNNIYETEKSTIDYLDIDKDDRLSQFVPKSTRPLSTIQNFENDDIDYHRENYEEEEYDTPDEENIENEKYKEKEEEKY